MEGRWEAKGVEDSPRKRLLKRFWFAKGRVHDEYIESRNMCGLPLVTLHGGKRKESFLPLFLISFLYTTKLLMHLLDVCEPAGKDPCCHRGNTQGQEADEKTNKQA